MRTLSELKEQSDRISIVHYASTPISQQLEVTNISVRNYHNNETKSFGHTTFSTEKEILQAWGEYVRSLASPVVVGWNFQSQTYGLPALEARWRANGISDPFPVGPSTAEDLDDILEEAAGPDYISGPEKLKRLSEMNGVTTMGYVPGKDEPGLQEHGEYQRLMISTERKVAMIASLLYLAFQGKLVTSPFPPKPEPKRTFMDSLEEQPFKSIVALNTLTLIYFFVGAVLLSLWISPIDFADPLKAMFIVAIVSDAVTLGHDFYFAFKRRNAALLWDSGGRIMFQIVFLITALGALFAFLFTPVAIPKSLGLDSDSKLYISIAALSPVFFTLKPITELMETLRRIL